MSIKLHMNAVSNEANGKKKDKETYLKNVNLHQSLTYLGSNTSLSAKQGVLILHCYQILKMRYVRYPDQNIYTILKTESDQAYWYVYHTNNFA